MKPKEAFDATMKRVDCMLNLYEALYNTRRRNMRKDWGENFKKFMRWPAKEKIYRIDGKDALLILRERSALRKDQFRHEELAELLRAALVRSVSALDRYCHDVLISRVIAQTDLASVNWPSELKKVAVPLAKAKEALNHAKKRYGKGGRKRTRPMNIIKQALDEKFHQELTLQSPAEIAQALSMIGVKGLWGNCAKGMNARAEDIKKRLNGIVARRNKIVHEGDIKRFKKGRRIVFNDHAIGPIRDDVSWLYQLVEVIDKLMSRRS